MRFDAARDADDQSCRENDLCGGVGDDPDRGEGRGRLADGESLSPGLEGGLAHAVGGAEGGDRLARGLPASNEVAPEGQFVNGVYVERLSREKRVLLTRSEEVRLERLVIAMAEKLQTSVKLSHLMRATLTLLQHAESELLRQCELAQAMKRPDNNSPGELLAFEGAIAEVVHRALHAATPFSNVKHDGPINGDSPPGSVTL
jgi:hypothetical protein